LQLGLRDEFIEHGDPVKLMALQGLDASGIEASVRQRFAAFAAIGLNSRA
jgi:1-deoxy-D-xylulose-5-phosphate synthase